MLSYELVKKAYLLLDDGDSRFLGRFDLTQVQYFALVELLAGAKPLSRLSRDLLCDPSNITRVAGILERKGWITRKRDKADRRVVLASLTETGKKLAAEVQAAHESFIRTRMGFLAPDERATLDALLRKLEDGLDRHLQEHVVSMGA